MGRGTAVDQTALADALNAGKLAGAALDVMDPEPLPKDDPLWDAKNLIITPHVSGNMTLGYTCEQAVDLFCRESPALCRRTAPGGACGPKAGILSLFPWPLVGNETRGRDLSRSLPLFLSAVCCCFYPDLSRTGTSLSALLWDLAGQEAPDVIHKEKRYRPA